ncbi:hypothetical protein [Hymenobacter daeguensis]
MALQPVSASRTVLIEIAWLLGSWAFSWLLLSRLLGYDYLRKPQLDIQLHNTYFVLQPLMLTTLLFLPIATVLTGVRVSVGAFRHFGRHAVLKGLAISWSLALLLAVAGWVFR